MARSRIECKKLPAFWSIGRRIAIGKFLVDGLWGHAVLLIYRRSSKKALSDIDIGLVQFQAFLAVVLDPANFS